VRAFLFLAIRACLPPYLHTVYPLRILGKIQTLGIQTCAVMQPTTSIPTQFRDVLEVGKQYFEAVRTQLLSG
jgi:hypothetical protein